MDVWTDPRMAGLDPESWAPPRELSMSFTLRSGSVRLVLLKDARGVLASVEGVPRVEDGATAVEALRKLREEVLEHRGVVSSAIGQVERLLPQAPSATPRYRLLGDLPSATALLALRGHAASGLGEAVHYALVNLETTNARTFAYVGALTERRVPVYGLRREPGDLALLPGLALATSELDLVDLVLQKEPRWLSTP